jgi:hypothetical protein
LAPARDGSPADPRNLTQPRHPLGRGPVPEYRNQNHDGSHEHLPAQEAERSWSASPPTAFPCAAEAEAPTIGFFNVIGTAPGFARINGAVQRAAAEASRFSAFDREIFIEFQKECVKAGIGEQVLVQRIVSFTLASKRDKETPLEGLSQAFRWGLAHSIDLFDQNPSQNHQLPRSLSKANPTESSAHIATIFDSTRSVMAAQDQFHDQ